jgi:hypothetical protein
MSQQIALSRFIPTVNWQANEIRSCPESLSCCRQFDSRGWGTYIPNENKTNNGLEPTYNNTHYWGAPFKEPSEYRNITAGVLARLNETAWAFVADCSTSGSVNVAFLPYNAGRIGKAGMMFVLGTVAASLLAIM